MKQIKEEINIKTEEKKKSNVQKTNRLHIKYTRIICIFIRVFEWVNVPLAK